MKTLFPLSNKTWLLVAFIAFTFSACDDDEVVPNEQELITTVRLSFTLGSESLVFNARDLDGPGGSPLVVDSIFLAVNTVYNLSVEFLDEQDPADVKNITEEVRSEAEEHLVCYEAMGVPMPSGLDLDSMGRTLGLKGVYTTSGTNTGTLVVSLKHMPNKLAANPCITGDTDVEVTFPVFIK